MINRIKYLFKKVGFLNSIIVFFDEFIFDAKYQTNTKGIIKNKDLEIKTKHCTLGNRCESILPIYLNALFDELQNIFFKNSINTKDYNFIDVGAGTGRGCILALNQNFKSVSGVEYSKVAFEIAKKNTRKTKASLLLSDIRDLKLKDQKTVFLLFNPFGDEILNSFLVNISSNIKKDCFILYVNLEEESKKLLDDYCHLLYYEKKDKFGLYTPGSTAIYKIGKYNGDNIK